MIVSYFSHKSILKLSSSLAYLKLLLNTGYFKVQVLVSWLVKQANALYFTDCMVVTFCLLIEMDMKFSCNENNLNYFFPNLKDFKGNWVYLDI